MIKLLVPFSEKDKVKALGANWNLLSKVWQVKDNVDINLFKQWLPISNEEMMCEAVSTINVNPLFIIGLNKDWLHYVSKTTLDENMTGKWILFTSLTSSSFEIFKILCDEIDPGQAKISIHNKFATTDNVMCFYSSSINKYQLQSKILNALDKLIVNRPDLYSKFKFNRDPDKLFIWKLNSTTTLDWQPDGKLTQILKIAQS